MHYYKRNLGDYAKKAGRLSMLQHGAYTLLIDVCYDREKFPTLDEAMEWAWASSNDEIDAVTFVLFRYFDLVDGVYVQKRIQEEILEYRDKAEKNQRIAHERETKRKEKGTNRARTVHEHVANGARFVHDTVPDVHETPPNQEPLTINQEPVTIRERVARGSRLPQNFDPDFQFAVDAGIQNALEEAHKFRDYWNSQPGQKGVKTDWQATWRNWCRNAKKNAKPYVPEWRTEQRKRTLEAVPAIAEGGSSHAADFFDMEAKNVTAIALG